MMKDTLGFTGVRITKIGTIKPIFTKCSLHQHFKNQITKQTRHFLLMHLGRGCKFAAGNIELVTRLLSEHTQIENKPQIKWIHHNGHRSFMANDIRLPTVRQKQLLSIVSKSRSFQLLGCMHRRYRYHRMKESGKCV